ncbi:MAG: S-methyl-5-thioribose-1-phosphate isomerase [Methanomassiliicoccales archaeon]|nr:S-methyl-5-thioribose-1-phosphate isomerase [Methanomassiliicoccales archaeon]NYT14437.1 S-methyl-5-thioribose-1-phosphate isomerase [Methanomassiliicoccales archaeon]
MKVVIGNGESDIRSVWFENGRVRMIDQRTLPQRFIIVDFDDHRKVAEAIANMTIRGAPSIGAAAAYGMALAAIRGQDIAEAEATLKGSRPTANDLFYAVDHMLNSIRSGADALQAAEKYADTIVDRCRRIGEYGSSLIEDGAKIMTHCNAGALAAVDIGTALASIREAWTKGKQLFVYVSETRPRLQGMRLTAWELLNEGIPHAIIPDGASGHYMKQGVDMVITGADRIASNGDFANKIGTYEKAVIAKQLGIPFYVAAPFSTFDFSISNGEKIPIEHRSEDEVTMINGTRIAPLGSPAFNPAFDVTPAELVTAFITEIGVLKVEDIHKIRGENDVL